MTVEIVPMLPEHLDRVVAIELRAHQFPWSEPMIRGLNGRGSFHHILLIDHQVSGYFYAQNIVGEVSLLNIAIDPACQGHGYGRQLMLFFLTLCEHQRAENVWLEVRESNVSACALYQNVGFHEVDRRVGYYPAVQGREDALIMSYVFDDEHTFDSFAS